MHFGETKNPTSILAKRTQAGNMRPNQPAAARNSRRRNFIVSGCHLQRGLQLTRAGRIERSRFCLRAAAAITSNGVSVHPGGASPSHRTRVCGAPIALPSEPRRPHATLFFVRQAPAVRFAPTDSCAWRLRRRPRAIAVTLRALRDKRIAREELCVLAGSLARLSRPEQSLMTRA